MTSRETTHIVYAGKPLRSRMECHWKVRLWDGREKPTAWSKPAFWTMGLLEPGDVTAQWIGLDGEMIYPGHESENNPPLACPLFRKEFKVAVPIRRATLYASALGVYRFHINGRPVGNDYFTPGWTDYHKRVYYNTYDVTDMIETGGPNAIGGILARRLVRRRHRLGIASLSIRPAPAAVCPARDRAGRWHDPDRGDRRVLEDGLRPAGRGRVPRRGDVRRPERDRRLGSPRPGRLGLEAGGDRQRSGLLARGRSRPPGGTTGGNSGGSSGGSSGGNAGCCKYRVCPAVPGLSRRDGPGDRRALSREDHPAEVGCLCLRYGSELRRLRPAGGSRAGGHETHPALRRGAQSGRHDLHEKSPRRTRHRHLHPQRRRRGEGDELWQPRFTYHGFRYVELTGYPGKPHNDTVTGVVIGSNCPPAGSFECSNPMVNRLYQNIVWTQRANFMSVPTDCPQRDERLGWMGDAEAFCRTATYNADVAAFFTKWLVDVDDAQKPDGEFSDVSPRDRRPRRRRRPPGPTPA